MIEISKEVGSDIGVFERCVNRTVSGGQFQIKCKLGLWGVTAPSFESADNEARHYWIQYYSDGEYDKLLGKTKV